MGKFKVGDSVRAVETDCPRGFPVGSTGIITSDNYGVYEVRRDDTGIEWCFFESELEPAPKFKVGDRVNWTRVRGEYDGSTLEAHDGVYDFKLRATTGNHTYVFAHELEHAPLTIEPGKYYRTRDGRKVGPVGENRDSEYPIVCGVTPTEECLVQVAIWNRDGTNYSERCLDLVAEWTDEPPAAGNDNAAPAKFKVGDRVKFRDDYPSAARGKEAVVVELSRWGVMVDRQDGPFSRSTESEEDLRLVAPAKSSNPAIVALLENGQPRPAIRPFVHGDTASATMEAERLARNNPGKEFGVYELVATRREEKRYDYEWQRLAAEGKKLGAIRLLREATGLHLATAKDAVEDWVRRAA